MAIWIFILHCIGMVADAYTPETAYEFAELLCCIATLTRCRKQAKAVRCLILPATILSAVYILDCYYVITLPQWVIDLKEITLAGMWLCYFYCAFKRSSQRLRSVMLALLLCVFLHFTDELTDPYAQNPAEYAVMYFLLLLTVLVYYSKRLSEKRYK